MAKGTIRTTPLRDKLKRIGWLRVYRAAVLIVALASLFEAHSAQVQAAEAATLADEAASRASDISEVKTMVDEIDGKLRVN